MVSAVAVTPDWRYAVSGSYDKTLRLWDLESGELLRTLEDHTDHVQAVAVTPDGARAVSGSMDKTLKLWDLESGMLLHTMKGHTGPVWAVAVTPNGTHAVSASWGKTLKLWDLQSGDEIRSTARVSTSEKTKVTPEIVSQSRQLIGHQGWVLAIALTPDGLCAVSGSHDKTLKIWYNGRIV